MAIRKKAIVIHFSTPRMRVSTISRLSGGRGRDGRLARRLGGLGPLGDAGVGLGPAHIASASSRLTKNRK